MNKKVTLIALPFAGGNSYSFQQLQPHLADNINFVPVELPGRGVRISEDLITDINVLVNDIFETVKAIIIEEKEYVILGHSMGALLGYLLLDKIEKSNLPLPLHFFASGANAPAFEREEEMIYKMPKINFIDKLRELGGSPKEVLENETIMEFFTPILRADFEVVETYQHQQSKPLNVPTSVLIGTEDKITLTSANQWQNEFNPTIKVYEFSGKHFFIFDHLQQICKLINTTISQ